ncbi:MAG: heavy metal translocating P-type ATPase [Desulfobacteraceae bacterium]|nr:heavy metal translocating P-type ATPase [Desulfobacteraceae bacterium]
MFIEICVISYGLHAGSSLYEKFRKKTKSLKPDLPVGKQDNETFFPPDHSEKYAKTVKRNFAMALASVGFSLAGILFSPVFGYVSIVIIIYLLTFILRRFVNTLLKRHHLPIEFLDLGYITILLFSGTLFSASLASLIYCTYARLRLATENRTEHTYIDMMKHDSQTVWLVKEDTEIEVPVESVEIDDIIAVRAGETITVDGIIVSGAASISEHMLTGEFQPAEKETGDPVSAATVLMSGMIRVRVEKSGRETSAARIISAIEKTREVTAYMESVGQELADKSVIPVSVIALAALPFFGLQGAGAIFMSNFLGAMRLFAPITMLNFIHIGSREGILFKDGRSLLLLSQVDTVVFDKTGTLTQDRQKVGRIHTFRGASEETVLTLAGAAEQRQSHPVALAILDEIRARELVLPEIDESDYRIGYGITVKTGGQKIRVGSLRFMGTEETVLPENFDKIMETAFEQGFSIVCVAQENNLIGAVELEPTLRPGAEYAVHRLKAMHKEIHIVSGDHERPTRTIAHTLGIDGYAAEILPEQKAELIEHLREKGKTVCFVGDGINDAIALKKADVSVSVKGSSAAAGDSAQIVLEDFSLEALPRIFELASDFQDNMHSTFLAVTYPGVMGIGGVFFAHFDIFKAFIMYILSTAGGVAVSMHPLLKEMEKKEESAPRSS